MEELVAVFTFYIHTCMYGYLQTHGTKFLPCAERRFNCCAGYMLDENKARCIKCPVGYHGPQCKTSCGFPLYGQFCQSICFCEVSECNHKEGCHPANRTGTIVTQTSSIPKEEVSVNLNQDFGSRTSTHVYVSTVDDRVVQNNYYPPSSTYTYIPNIDDSWASSLRISIIILIGLCIILMILYAASFGIKLKKPEHEPHLIQLEARDNY